MNDTVKTALTSLTIVFLLIGLSIPKTSALVDMTLMAGLFTTFIYMMMSSKKN